MVGELCIWCLVGHNIVSRGGCLLDAFFHPLLYDVRYTCPAKARTRNLDSLQNYHVSCREVGFSPLQCNHRTMVPTRPFLFEHIHRSSSKPFVLATEPTLRSNAVEYESYSTPSVGSPRTNYLGGINCVYTVHSTVIHKDSSGVLRGGTTVSSSYVTTGKGA